MKYLLFFAFLFFSSFAQANMPEAECAISYQECLRFVGNGWPNDPCYGDHVNIDTLQCSYQYCICRCVGGSSNPSSPFVCSNTRCLPNKENLKDYKYSKACKDYMK